MNDGLIDEERKKLDQFTQTIIIRSVFCSDFLPYSMLQLLVLWQCYQVVVNIIKRDAYHNENRNGDDAAIPDISHRHHRLCLCKNLLPSVIFSRLNAKNCHFTV